MCGRYGRAGSKQAIAEAFHLIDVPADLTIHPSYNIAPSTEQPVIRNNREDERQLFLANWGLRPRFAETADTFKAFTTNNARCESLQKKPIWQIQLESHRCIIPIEWYYEWQILSPSEKQPYAFGMADGSMLGAAGLWDAWKDKITGAWYQSFTIITTDANELGVDVHQRMPAILRPREYDEWLDRTGDRPPPLHLLRPLDSDLMYKKPVNKAVGNVRNNYPELLNSA